MSQTFSLVCPETKLSICIGQGSFGDGMRSFYTGEPQTMERLKRFLNAHRGKTLVFACDDEDLYPDCKEFEDPDRPRCPKGSDHQVVEQVSNGAMWCVQCRGVVIPFYDSNLG